MAAAKKDFSSSNIGKVYGAVSTATTKSGQQGEASPQEAQERAEQLRTQGRKGAVATRINMAFTPSNYDFIKVMSKIKGMSLTEFTNYVLAQYRKEHSELYDQAKAIGDQL